MTITFGVDQVQVYAADPGDGERSLPGAEDLARVVGTAGDRFRDSFTRLCLYAARNCDEDAERACDTVIVGTEYGNAEALGRLQRDALSLGRRLSPQAFPQAISGAAAASVAMATGATGANLTLGGHLLTPAMALWRAHATLERSPQSVCRLLVGDMYCAQTREDALRHEPGLDCRSGVAHAVLARGEEFSAVFDFRPPASPDSPAPPGHRVHGGPAAGGPEPAERNGAFALGRFLRRILGLGVGETAVLECRKSPSQHATVRVTRMSDRTTEPGRSQR